MSDLSTSQNERLASVKQHLEDNRIRVPLKGIRRLLGWYDQQIGNLVDKTFDSFLKKQTPEQIRSVAYDPMFDELADGMPFRAGSSSSIDAPVRPEVAAAQREFSDGTPRVFPWEQLRPPSLTVNSNGIAYVTHNGRALIRQDLARMDHAELLEVAEAEGIPVGEGSESDAWNAWSTLEKLMNREEQNYARN